MTQIPSPLHPPERLLCGPGPCNVSPAALAAMQRPLLGHMDPDLLDLLTEVISLLRIAYQASGGLVLPLQATGTSGMEAGLAHLLELACHPGAGRPACPPAGASLCPS